MESTDSISTTKSTESAVTAPSPSEIGLKVKVSIPEKMRTRCSIWSRVMGYHRPVSYYNIGKKQEFADRKYFKQPKED